MPTESEIMRSYAAKFKPVINKIIKDHVESMRYEKKANALLWTIHDEEEQLRTYPKSYDPMKARQNLALKYKADVKKYREYKKKAFLLAFQRGGIYPALEKLNREVNDKYGMKFYLDMMSKYPNVFARYNDFAHDPDDFVMMNYTI